MIEVQFGDKLLEMNVDRLDLEDLIHSKANNISTLILSAIREEMVKDMRRAIGDGDINKANGTEGYLKCLEHLEEFFTVSISEALKESK